MPPSRDHIQLMSGTCPGELTQIGERLRACVGTHNQDEYARRIDVNRRTLQRWIEGAASIRLESVIALRREFGVDPAWLLTGEREQFGSAVLRPNEGELIGLYREAPEVVQTAVLAALAAVTREGQSTSNESKNDGN